MWWWGGYHWWWAGPVLMAVFMVACVAVMALMRGHGRMPAGMAGMCGFWGRHYSGRHETDAPGQILDERLARGEMDIKEYRRIQERLAETTSSAGGEKVGDQQ